MSIRSILMTVPRSRLSRSACYAALAGLALFFLALAIQDIWVADLWWQLRTGQWIAEHRALPAVDTLSFTAAGKEWIEMRWLYCLLAYLGWQAGGPALLVLLQTAVLGAAFFVLAWGSRRILTTLPGVLVMLLGVWAGSTRFVVRPELISYLLLPVFLVVLDGLRRGRFARLGKGLPALQILWTNSHTLFIFGPVLCWTFTAGEALSRVLRRGHKDTSGGEGRRDAGVGGADAGRAVHGNPARERGRAAQSADSPGAPALNRRMATLSLLVTAACWINPYFHRGATFPLLLFREIHAGSILGRTITEFRSPFAIELWTWDMKAAAILAIASAATFALNWKRTDPVRLAVWAAHLYLGGVAVRNLGLFAFAATWASLRNLEDTAAGAERLDATPRARAEASAAARPTEPSDAEHAPGESAAATAIAASAGAETSTHRSFPAIHAQSGAGPPVHRNSLLGYLIAFAHLVLAASLLCATWFIVTGRYNVVYGCEQQFGLGVAECNTPQPATEFLLESGASPQLFHAMSDGSYLTWAAKERFPVFVDGRLEVYGEAFIKEYLSVALGDWDIFADRWKINTVMAHREHLAPLYKKIQASSHWVLVYLDSRDVVFVRNIPEHAALIARYRIDLKTPWVPRRPEPEEQPAGWRRWIGSVARPWYLFGMAETFLALGSPANAAHYLDRALPFLSGDPRLRLRMGQLYFEGGDYARSAATFREALESKPSDPAHWCELGQALYLSGDLAGALDAYTEALRREPRMYTAHFNLGVILARRGDLPAAISHIQEALKARPGDAAALGALDKLQGLR